jgi:hypothetical protein
MRFFVGLLAVLAATTSLTSSARAESYDATQSYPPKDGYVGVGVELGGQRALMGGFFLDGGYRLGDTSLFAHGRVTGGASGSDGDYQQVRAGIEARSCSDSGWVCGFAGVDAGYQHDNMIDAPFFCWSGDNGGGCEPEMTEAHDLMAVPRVGVEVGRSVRARVAFDALLTTRLDERETRGGAALSVGLGYAF